MAAPAASVAETALLEHAVEAWLGERDHWAFTQRAVEYAHGRPWERLERYDPSREGDHRWTLLTINGRPPTAEEHETWARKKFRKHPRRFDQPLGEFFDFPAARVAAKEGALVRFTVPLRSDKSWLFPIDKVRVDVTVNTETGGIERLQARVKEPFRVFLGLAQIRGGNVNVSFLNFDPTHAADPEGTQPTGTVKVSVTRFGERIDFTWSDFQRVTPARSVARRSARR